MWCLFVVTTSSASFSALPCYINAARVTSRRYSFPCQRRSNMDHDTELEACSSDEDIELSYDDEANIGLIDDMSPLSDNVFLSDQQLPSLSDNEGLPSSKCGQTAPNVKHQPEGHLAPVLPDVGDAFYHQQKAPKARRPLKLIIPGVGDANKKHEAAKMEQSCGQHQQI